jgi:hypothetical protein
MVIGELIAMPCVSREGEQKGALAVRATGALVNSAVFWAATLVAGVDCDLLHAIASSPPARPREADPSSSGFCAFVCRTGAMTIAEGDRLDLAKINLKTLEDGKAVVSGSRHGDSPCVGFTHRAA